MRITVFGASGLLGRALMQECQGTGVTGLNSRQADIMNPEQVRVALHKTRPEWVVLAAAYTDVDGCESNSKKAFDVNCRGAIHVAEAAKDVDARLIFLSTDYVFDGKKNAPYEVDDPRAPQSVYGRSKAEAEEHLQNTSPGCCILRTSWLFGVGGKCFPDTILKMAATRPILDVVDDQRGSPTYTCDLARAIIQLCNAGATGIVHATNRGECSWYEFAREIVQNAGLKTMVRPTTSEQFARPAPRPEYSVLSPSSLVRYGIVMPTWQDALPRYLAERAAVSTKP
ncbi:MAG TPA: dTDP-4-dehydrorhamnose reductase [Terriglobales bacterium]|jgi:dTDP-4-dehydrorhamnose reductase